MLAAGAQQVTVSGTYSSVGRFDVFQIFEGHLSNNSPATLSGISVHGELSSSFGLLLVSWKSRETEVLSGINSFSELGITPELAEINIGNEFIRDHRFLDAGNYTLKLKVYQTVNGVLNLLQENSFPLISTNFPNVRLVSLMDRDTIPHKNPVFNWSALLTPRQSRDGNNESALKYRLTVKALYDPQSATEAMLYNPVIHQSDLQDELTYTYPFHAYELEDSSSYVWQVEAVSGNQVVARSEVWIFTIWNKRKPKPNVPIVILNPEKGTNSIMIQKNLLKVGYHEKSGSVAPVLLKASVTTLTGQELFGSEQLDFRAVAGFNSFEVSLCPDGLDLPDGEYILNLYTIHGKLMQVRFKYKRTNGCQ